MTKIVQFLAALLALVGGRSSNASRAENDRRTAAAQSALIAASGASNMSSAD